MRSKKWYMAGLVVLFCFFLSGCQKKQPDSYIEGSDYQYANTDAFFSYVQEGDGVWYFSHEHYLYYLDEDEGLLLPLCGKADCLHDKETDAEKIEECNAYINTEGTDTGIAYCNGYVYYVDKEVGDNRLYRFSSDGAKREQIYQWEEDVSVLQWIVHRDVLYYAEQSYFVGEDGTEERYAMKSISLTGNGVKKPKTIYTAENLTVYSLANPEAYGNYLYFEIVAMKKADEEITDDNYLKYQYTKTFIYDMEKEKVKELTIPDMPENGIIQGVTFWQDKILFQPYQLDKDKHEKQDYYIADLDGSNIEIFMEDIEQGKSLRSDGRYLYCRHVF